MPVFSKKLGLEAALKITLRQLPKTGVSRRRVSLEMSGALLIERHMAAASNAVDAIFVAGT
jgi:hypothetical protein